MVNPIAAQNSLDVYVTANTMSLALKKISISYHLYNQLQVCVCARVCVSRWNFLLFALPEMARALR